MPQSYLVIVQLYIVAKTSFFFSITHVYLCIWRFTIFKIAEGVA